MRGKVNCVDHLMIYKIFAVIQREHDLAMIPIKGKLKLINYTVNTVCTLFCSTLGVGNGEVKASQGSPSNVFPLSALLLCPVILLPHSANGTTKMTTTLGSMIGLQCHKEHREGHRAGEGNSSVSENVYFPVYGQEWISVYGISIIFHYVFMAL